MASRIRPWPTNPRYWEYNGKPVLLIGASGQDNLFQHQDGLGAEVGLDDTLEEHLDRMVAAGGNYVRNTLSTRDSSGLGDSKLRFPWFYDDVEEAYDLDQWNMSYFTRLNAFLAMCEAKGVVVCIELFDAFDWTNSEVNAWELHPMRPLNNVNYTQAATGVPNSWSTAPHIETNPVFTSVLAVNDLDDDELIAGYLDSFVQRVLDETLDFPNVLYLVSNETSMPSEYSFYFADLILARGALDGKSVHVSEMLDERDLTHADHVELYNEVPARLSFNDNSQATHGEGQDHWDQLIAQRALTDDPVRPINATKVYYRPSPLSNDHPLGESTRHMWRNLLAGMAVSRYHRSAGLAATPSGIGLSIESINCMKAIRRVELVVNFMDLSPAMGLLSDRATDEAYAAQNIVTGATVVFFPRVGSVTLDISGLSGLYNFRWMSVDTGQWTEVDVIDTSGASLALATPDPGFWVAVLDPVNVEEQDRRWLDGIDGSDNRRWLDGITGDEFISALMGFGIESLDGVRWPWSLDFESVAGADATVNQSAVLALEWLGIMRVPREVGTESLVSTTATWAGLLEALDNLRATRTLAIEALKFVNDTRNLDIESFQPVRVDSEVLQESLRSVAATRSLVAETLQLAHRTLVLYYENAGVVAPEEVSISVAIALESLSSTVEVQDLDVESLLSQGVATEFPIESLLDLKVERILIAEALQTLWVIRSLSTESLSRLRADEGVLLENQVSVEKTTEIFIEAMSLLQYAHTLRYESGGLVAPEAVDAAIAVSFEVLGRFALDWGLDVEAFANQIVTIDSSVEALARIAANNISTIEVLRQLVSSYVLDLETLANRVIETDIPIETLIQTATNHLLLIEALRRFTALRLFNKESLTSTVVGKISDLETLQEVGRITGTPLESLMHIVLERSVELESLGRISASRLLDIETLAIVNVTQTFYTETLIQVIEAGTIHLESLEHVVAVEELSYEVRSVIQAVVQTTTIHLDTLGHIARGESLSVESLRPVDIDEAMTLESLGRIAEAETPGFESLQGIRSGTELPTEAFSLIRAETSLAIEVVQGIDVVRGVQLEILTGARSNTLLHVESAARVARSVQSYLEATGISLTDVFTAVSLSLESLGPSSVEQELDLEAFGLITKGRLLSLESLVQAAETIVVELESLSDVEGDEELQIEALGRIAAVEILLYEVLSEFLLLNEPAGHRIIRGSGGPAGIMIKLIGRVLSGGGDDKSLRTSRGSGRVLGDDNPLDRDLRVPEE